MFPVTIEYRALYFLFFTPNKIVDVFVMFTCIQYIYQFRLISLVNKMKPLPMVFSQFLGVIIILFCMYVTPRREKRKPRNLYVYLSVCNSLTHVRTFVTGEHMISICHLPYAERDGSARDNV